MKSSPNTSPTLDETAQRIAAMLRPTIRKAIDRALSVAKSNVDHTGSGMVSLDVAPGILPALPGGIDDHHITVVFFGKDVSDDLFEAVCALAESVASTVDGPLTGVASGLGTFPPSESSDNKVPVFVRPDVDGLDELRAAFEPFNASEHANYKPHITLAYLDEGDALPASIPSTLLSFDHIAVHRGDEVRRFSFGEEATKGSPDPKDFAEYRNRIYSVQLDALRHAGVTKIAWKGGACKRCQVNKAASPIDINQFWPDGPPPLHENCGCKVVPAE
jgi:2'-5' RNA ligase